MGSSVPASGGLNHPFLYNHGQMLDLGTLGGAYGFAQSINNLGQITGYAQGPNGNPRAFTYSNGSMSFLGGSLAYMSYGSVNDQGQIAGSYYSSSSGPERAFLYSNGTVTDLGSLGSGWALAAGINNLGQVTGYSQRAGGPSRAFIYSNGHMTDLGALSTDTWGTAINDLGQVVGYGNVISSAQQHAFLWTSGHMIDLGSPYGPDYGSLALGINNLGQVVGWYVSGDEHAFLYSGAQMYDLDSLTEIRPKRISGPPMASMIVGKLPLVVPTITFIYSHSSLNPMLPASCFWPARSVSGLGRNERYPLQDKKYLSPPHTGLVVAKCQPAAIYSTHNRFVAPRIVAPNIS